MLYNTRFCPRSLSDIPFTGHRPSQWWHWRYSWKFACWYQREPRHRCIDCWWLQLRWRIARLFAN
jgi:hypothetical protein